MKQKMELQVEIIKSKRKTIEIAAKEGKFIVRAPLDASDAYLRDVIESRREWMEKQLIRMQKIQESRSSVKKLTGLEEAALYLRAKKEFTVKTAKYAALMHVSYGKISIRCQKTRWGSCSSNGNLSFNMLLMLAPEQVRDYVIIHELCHLLQMNHSSDFYRVLEQWCPDWKKCRNWLKEYGAFLQSRISRDQEE